MTNAVLPDAASAPQSPGAWLCAISTRFDPDTRTVFGLCTQDSLRTPQIRQLLLQCPGFLRQDWLISGKRRAMLIYSTLGLFGSGEKAACDGFSLTKHQYCLHPSTILSRCSVCRTKLQHLSLSPTPLLEIELGPRTKGKLNTCRTGVGGFWWGSKEADCPTSEIGPLESLAGVPHMAPRCVPHFPPFPIPPPQKNFNPNERNKTKSDEEIESNDSPLGLQDEYVKESAELEERCQKPIDAMKI